MSLLHNEELNQSSFTIWQLRTSYLSTIKDGIGDRLINVNHSVLNTPGFRAAGWPSASANHGTQLGASIKRTYSPPIPTTTAVSSEYYQLGTRDTNDAQRFGFGEDAEDEEGGMVTGKTGTDVIGRIGRSGKRTHRGERQQREHQKARDEEEDSSDLSDESDDDGDSTQRPSHQIKFTKMPVRIRADSSPIRATDRQDRPQVMVTSPSYPSLMAHYRTGSLGTAPSINERRRRDTTTTTSSDMSSDNELASSGFKRRQIQFSGCDQVIEPPIAGHVKSGNTGLKGLDEQAEDSGAESVESALSSEFDATAGSASLLEGVGITGSLNSSSPIALMHKLQNTASSQAVSPRKPKTPAPELQDLPPPRPISTLEPVSLLSKALNARKQAPTNPVEKFAVLSGKGLTDSLNIRLYIPFSSDPEEPLDLPLARESKLADQPAPVTVVEAIGLALWRYSEERREPSIERSKLTVNRWALRMVEDGEVEYDFPALARMSAIADFTSNNNRAAGARGRSRGKQYDEFALVEASDSEFEENERLYPIYNVSAPAEETGDAPAVPSVTAGPPAALAQSKTSRLNPILGQPFSSALNDNTLTPADRPAVPTSHATPRLGISKTLKIRFINLEGSTQVTTLNTSTDSYIAEILDSVCKRWGLDKGNYLLKVMGSNTIAPLDRTVEALGNITELDLVRRRFGPQLTGSPGSSSPNAPLLVENPAVPSKKGKKSGQRMLHPLNQKQDLIGGYYRRYYVLRKQSMGFTTSNHRILTFDNDYMHIMPGDTGKTGSDTKTRSISFNDVVGCKVSRRHPKNFRVVVLRGNDATEQKRYDFEARNALEAGEIVDEIKKNMAHYRI
ncbi:stress activated MAP kinase interacting protein [Aspergillus ochraceoroseus]|uniref:Stress activated MAP kinase interacting protein n=1 Tax=Aspergillus ochraceoroseus TaxID=138278 RepID=A0A0F8U3S4_9EURO|nr:stress activated MAP kinase interacting protein [Aspergillus ochraceoroseus]